MSQPPFVIVIVTRPAMITKSANGKPTGASYSYVLSPKWPERKSISMLAQAIGENASAR
jgi:hypothetical protein